MIGTPGRVRQLLCDYEVVDPGAVMQVIVADSDSFAKNHRKTGSSNDQNILTDLLKIQNEIKPQKLILLRNSTKLPIEQYTIFQPFLRVEIPSVVEVTLSKRTFN